MVDWFEKNASRSSHYKARCCWSLQLMIIAADDEWQDRHFAVDWRIVVTFANMHGTKCLLERKVRLPFMERVKWDAGTLCSLYTDSRLPDLGLIIAGWSSSERLRRVKHDLTQCPSCRWEMATSRASRRLGLREAENALQQSRITARNAAIISEFKERMPTDDPMEQSTVPRNDTVLRWRNRLLRHTRKRGRLQRLLYYRV